MDMPAPSQRSLLSWIVALGAALLIAAMIALVAIGAAGSLVDERRAADETIRVSGEGMVTVAPDHATVRATTEARNESSAKALEAANERMERVLDAVRDAGIDDADMTTSGVQTHREFDRTPDGPPRPIGWVASMQLTIEIDDLDKVGAVLAAASRAGAQGISGPDYTVRDRNAAMQDALREAMRDARGSAEAIARASDRDLAQVQSVEQQVQQRPTPGRYMAATDAELVTGDASLDVTPGETHQIHARVTVSYEHEDG